MDKIGLQNAEFDAVSELAEQYRRITCTPIVDDDYPEVRCTYERALSALIEALKSNGRFANDADGLRFNVLRSANLERLGQFKNARGEFAHTAADGSDWSNADWLTAVVGELGELANFMKKVRRGDMTPEEAFPMISGELADVQTYLDILAFRLDVDLGRATIDKFNRISERVGAKVFIRDDGSDWSVEP